MSRSSSEEPLSDSIAKLKANLVRFVLYEAEQSRDFAEEARLSEELSTAISKAVETAVAAQLSTPTGHAEKLRDLVAEAKIDAVTLKKEIDSLNGLIKGLAGEVSRLQKAEASVGPLKKEIEALTARASALSYTTTPIVITDYPPSYPPAADPPPPNDGNGDTGHRQRRQIFDPDQEKPPTPSPLSSLEGESTPHGKLRIRLVVGGVVTAILLVGLTTLWIIRPDPIRDLSPLTYQQVTGLKGEIARSKLSLNTLMSSPQIKALSTPNDQQIIDVSKLSNADLTALNRLANGVVTSLGHIDKTLADSRYVRLRRVESLSGTEIDARQPLADHLAAFFVFAALTAPNRNAGASATGNGPSNNAAATGSVSLDPSETDSQLVSFADLQESQEGLVALLDALSKKLNAEGGSRAN